MGRGYKGGRPENGRPSSQSRRAGWGCRGGRPSPGRAATANHRPLQRPHTKILVAVSHETRSWDALGRNVMLGTLNPEPALDLLQQDRRPPALCGRGSSPAHEAPADP